MSDSRWAQDCERLRSAVERAIESHIAMANQLDTWATQSQTGGWSTHQVEPMIKKANDLRREAAELSKQFNLCEDSLMSR